MKKALVLSFIVSLSLSLTGCKKSWNSFNTPEKFLNMAAKNPDNCTIAVNGEYKTNPHRDYKLEIQQALSNAGSFKQSSLTEPTSQRYFSYANMYYNGLIGLEGDLFCIMSVYDDGFIKIDYEYYDKELLHNYAYFEMDANKAYTINGLVVSKIERDEQIIAEDRMQANRDASIDNFITAMEKKGSVRTIYYDNHEDNTQDTYEYLDKGELLSLIKDVEYVSVNKSYPIGSSVALIYNAYNINEGRYWTYSLYDTGNYVGIQYNYTNRLNVSCKTFLSYEIDASQGKAILAKALELGKK